MKVFRTVPLARGPPSVAHPGSLSLATFPGPAFALCPLSCTVPLADSLDGMDWLEHLWVAIRRASGGLLGGVGTGFTLDLRLVHDEVTGGPTALKLLRAALLGTELFVLSLVEGKSCGGETTVAGSASKGCQWVLLGMKREKKGKKVTKSRDNPDSGYRIGFVFQPSPSPSLSLTLGPQASLAVFFPCLSPVPLHFPAVLRYN